VTRARAVPAIEVCLSRSESERAKREGRRRQEFSAHRADTHGFVGDGEIIHVQGCYGEIAVAALRGSSWVGFSPDFEELRSDVDGLQVRTTRYPTGKLLLHPKDPDDQRFVLCRTHLFPTVLVVGWVWGEEAKVKENWRRASPQDRREPCYWVPNESLRDPRELRP